MNPVDLDALRRNLHEYDPSLPRCPKKIEEHRNYAPSTVEFNSPEWDNYTVTYHVPCCRPERHEGDCRNSRRVMGWPGMKTLNALIDEVEYLRRQTQEDRTMDPRYDQRTIGTCSRCGGLVTVPTVWNGVIPPTPTCAYCGAVAASSWVGPTLPVIPTVPAPAVQTTTGSNSQ